MSTIETQVDPTGKGPATLVDVSANPEHARRLKRMEAILAWLSDCDDEAVARAMVGVRRLSPADLERVEQSLASRLGGRVERNAASRGLAFNSNGAIQIASDW